MAVIYSGHRGCLAGQIVSQGLSRRKKRTLTGVRITSENKKKRVVKTESRRDKNDSAADNLLPIIIAAACMYTARPNHIV